MVMFCEHSSELCIRVGRQGSVHSDFYRWSVLLVLGCRKNTFIDLSPFSVYLCNIPRLTLDARFRAIEMLQGGATQADVANQFGVHRHTVQSLWTRYQVMGLAHDRSGSGRPGASSQRQDVYIRGVHLRNHYQSAEATAQIIPGRCRVSGRTVQNRLRAHGIRPHRPCVRPLLLLRHRRARLQWSQNH